MDYTEEMLKGCALTEQQMEADLAVLSSHYEAMGVDSELIPATQLIPLPTLTAILTDETGFSRIISHSWVAMPLEAARQTKYLQFYSELMLPTRLEHGALLEGCAALNEQLPLGHCFPLRLEGKPEVVGLRWLQSFPIGTKPDLGSFTESVTLFDYSCQIVQEFLDLLSEGSSVPQAIAALH